MISTSIISLRRYSSSRRIYSFYWLPLLRFCLNTTTSSDYHGGYHHLHSATTFCRAFSPPTRTVKSNYFTITTTSSSAATPRTGSKTVILPFAMARGTTSRSLLRGTSSSTLSKDGESSDVGRKKKVEVDADASRSKTSPNKKSKTVVKKKSTTTTNKKKKANSIGKGKKKEESKKKKKSPSKKTAAAADYLCYLLTSTNPNFKQRTYVGITNNINRRLRQHNGELVGGASATRIGKPWKIWMTVEGFPTHISSLQFEWMWKHMSPKKSHGKKSRINKLRNLFLNKERWTEKSPLAKTIPLIVTIYDDEDINNNYDDETLIMDPWVFDLLTTGGIDKEEYNNVITLLPEYVQVVKYDGVVVDVVQNEREEEEVEKK
jgi:predicted GIY-YIG superfamily endonuclease